MSDLFRSLYNNLFLICSSPRYFGVISFLRAWEVDKQNNYVELSAGLISGAYKMQVKISTTAY